jgi:dihydropteroate synthase
MTTVDHPTNGASAPLAFAWRAGRFNLMLAHPLVMGIVNVTPDSFSDGGRGVTEALDLVDHLVAQGADIIDIGGESTRPGSQPISIDTELSRVLPVVKHAVRLGVPVSVDTRHAPVMQAVLDAGADIINDVSALQETGALAVVAAHPACGVCLMHMQGDPSSMQQDPQYIDVVHDVKHFLAGRLQAAQAAGIAAERLCVDPGIGFGKTPEQNVALLARQAELLRLKRPLLVGWSRKSTLGLLTGGRPPGERLAASLAAALAAVRAGAHIVRVHDVAATKDALAVWRAANLA